MFIIAILLIIFIIIFIIIILALLTIVPRENLGFVETVENSYGNIKVVSNLNHLYNTADVTIKVFFPPGYFEKMGNQSFLIKLTEMDCTIYGGMFFNDTFAEEIKKLDEDYNPKENPVEGYKVTKATIILSDEETKEAFSRCIVTGPSKVDMKIEYFKTFPEE